MYICGTKEGNMKNTLIEILKKETESLKAQYVEMTKKWANVEFNRICNLDKRYSAKGSFEEMGSSNYYQAQKYLHRSGYLIISAGADKFVEIQVKNAISHYEFSIEKLAFRIEKKGLDQSNLTVGTSHVGVNIDTTLTDGKKSVHAFTIIASGAIQRPHYRYLIK